MTKEKEFLLDLAQVLEKHNIAIISKKTESNSEFTEIAFQYQGSPSRINIGRCHLTQYNLRGAAGMSNIDANEMYQILKRTKNNQIT